MYNIDNCVLIRKTSVFPNNNIVETPIHGQAYAFGSSSILGDALSKRTREIISGSFLLVSPIWGSLQIQYSFL